MFQELRPSSLLAKLGEKSSFDSRSGPFRPSSKGLPTLPKLTVFRKERICRTLRAPNNANAAWLTMCCASADLCANIRLRLSFSQNGCCYRSGACLPSENKEFGKIGERPEFVTEIWWQHYEVRLMDA